jgi:hypothetical protein
MLALFLFRLFPGISVGLGIQISVRASSFPRDSIRTEMRDTIEKILWKRTSPKIVRDTLVSSRLDVACIQETKLGCTDAAKARSFLPFPALRFLLC